MRNRTFWQLIVSVCLLTGCTGVSPEKNLLTPFKKQTDAFYGVSASHPIAVDVGMNVLKNGGNAADAAIAISYILGVVEPFASGIGGGGGMLVIPAKGEPDFIDYRETSPSTYSGTGVSGVPGLVAGMEAIHQKYATKDMKRLIDPAVEYAEKGFAVDRGFSHRLETARYRVNSGSTRRFYPNGKAILPGEILVQKDLAKTLRTIQTKGSAGFYQGDIAKAVQAKTGIPLDDFKRYKVRHSEPVQGSFAGYEVFTAPPPFSGTTLLQMLKLAEETGLDPRNQAEYIDRIGKIAKASYEDRRVHIGDGVTAEEISKYISDDHISLLKKELAKDSGNRYAEEEEEHESTTHFVVMDKEGTVISATNTLSNYFGSGAYTNGFFLNDQLKNFADGGINGQAPNKRSRTFTAPTVMISPEEVIGIGSPGGNRIPQILMQVIYSYTKGEGDLQEIVNRDRFTFENSTIHTESPFRKDVLTELEARDYQVIHKVSPMFYGGVQGLIMSQKEKSMFGAGDPRRNGIWRAQHEKGK
ncbi:gamma-glutamyltransferase family protein [Cytobacillus firmus]|uniref:Gamma-glutamyltranspeptidase n=1 Tax=Cytobacillus firmus DS1 TaxID=1307436 RepID=W7L2W0_CYTFI|nr:gamma-glutamyltransferase [Cytobacillus firmus]EWG09936.1 gamma-glutamyltranspeptidase [Cytobacillus firmus DS1]